MKRILFLFIFLAFASITFAGTKEDIAQLQRSLLELQQQFWDLEKRVNDSSTTMESSVKGVQGTSEELRQVQASLNAKLEKILNELQALNEKLEETNNRVRDMSVPVAPTVAPEGSTSPNPELNETPPQTTRPVPSGPAPDLGENQLFKDAMGQYTKGRFEQALRAFQDLLDQYPGSRLSGEAQFMIGESYYGMKEYVDAVSEYDKVIKGYPDSDRVPGARLKKAFSLFSLGKKGQGVLELQQIAERYPNTKEAQIARQRLQEMGLE